MDGIHLLGEWYGCPADTPAFSQAAPLRELCVSAARNAGDGQAGIAAGAYSSAGTCSGRSGRASK